MRLWCSLALLAACGSESGSLELRAQSDVESGALAAQVDGGSEENATSSRDSESDGSTSDVVVDIDTIDVGGDALSGASVDVIADVPAGDGSGHRDAKPYGDEDAGCVLRNQCDGENCGDKDNGCGGLWHCGDCSGETPVCGSQKPNVCGPCIPKTSCEPLDCGHPDNGCGTTIDCTLGGCPIGTCGGSGAPNRCGRWYDAPACSETPVAGFVCVISSKAATRYCPNAIPAAQQGCTYSTSPYPYGNVVPCGGPGYDCSAAD